MPFEGVYAVQFAGTNGETLQAGPDRHSVRREESMKVLAIHGVGHADAELSWQAEWRGTITRGVGVWGAVTVPDVTFLTYDDLFSSEPLNTSEVLDAFTRLAASGLFYGLADVFSNRRGFGERLEEVRWTAGMVAQWVALEGLRKRLRDQLSAVIRKEKPDIIMAHSLGSLLAYDALRRDESSAAPAPIGTGITLVTFGSQLGNPAVRAMFGGRIEPLESVRFWWHLYNAQDDVFTTQIELPARAKFRQVETSFDIKGWADHEGIQYLQHPETGRTVYQDFALPQALALASTQPVSRALEKKSEASSPARSERVPQLRALLVGLAEYPNAADCLDGPVNDVFNVSATLQELGFSPDSIRVVLNERATAQAIRERLQWLLGDAQPGDTMVFFYAGHGAQVPGYGKDAEVDRVDECLVPYDFDWSLDKAIADDEFCSLYSQLPYDSTFIAALDCCHSGGMARAGNVKRRGLSPPDDIRHRMLRWNKDTQMWGLRERFEQGRSERRLRSSADKKAWLGDNGHVRRFGRATSLWLPTDAKFRQAAKANGHVGPYAPILLEACAEGECAYEYLHGVTAHGAFTYALCQVLREAVPRAGVAGKRLSYAQLLNDTAKRVRAVVGEPQSPQLVCPATRRNQAVPGTARRK
jgi:hypothetical protein